MAIAPTLRAIAYRGKCKGIALSENSSSVSRRSLLRLIGNTAGAAVMYQTMVSMGYAATSDFAGPIKLAGDVKKSSVVVLGAGLAGMTAAYELRKAGYKVQILEYNERPGGRNWSIYGGDRYTDLSGETQHVEFAKGQYLNPGPWRIPYHHTAMLYYCRMFNVPLETFTQVNYNAYVHSNSSFGGKPKRFREVAADFNGYVGELLAKATDQGKLDEKFTHDEKDALLRALRGWGALDEHYQYRKSPDVSDRRGYERDPGGGLNSESVDSDPMAMNELFKSSLWQSLIGAQAYDMQQQLFQVVGGMGMIGRAFARQLPGVIKYNSKVTSIHQNDKGVTVTYVDSEKGGTPKTMSADWCVCTIPLSILSRIPINVGPRMATAIKSVPYITSTKVGLQFARRFWEEDENIYGGITYTDQPFFNISYPSHGFFEKGPAVLLGAYVAGHVSAGAYGFEAQSAKAMVAATVEQGSLIHPQYKKEFQNGVAVVWHRVPWAFGCAGDWSQENRAKHYADLCAIDGRIVLAGEHASRLPAWQEGAVLSALDAVTRLHQRVLAT